MINVELNRTKRAFIWWSAIKQTVVVDKDICETYHSGPIMRKTTFAFVSLLCRLRHPFVDWQNQNSVILSLCCSCTSRPEKTQFEHKARVHWMFFLIGRTERQKCFLYVNVFFCMYTSSLKMQDIWWQSIAALNLDTDCLYTQQYQRHKNSPPVLTSDGIRSRTFCELGAGQASN